MLTDSVALLISKAAFIGLRILTLFIFSITLEKELFGAISLAFTITEIAKFIADWGVDTWSLRQFSNSEISFARHNFAKVIKIKIASSTIAILIANTAIELLIPEIQSIDRILISSLAATNLWLNISVNWLQARKLLRNSSISLLVTSLILVLIFYTLKQNKYTHTTFLLTLLLFETIIAIFLFIKSIKTGGSTKQTNELNIYLIAKETTPIAIATILALIYSRFDIFFIENQFNHKVLADYSFASRIVEPILFMASALSSTLYARASTEYQNATNNSSYIRNYAFEKIKKNIMISGAACGLIAIIAPITINRYLPIYDNAIPLLFALLIATTFRCINLSLTAIIQASGRYKTMMRISIINTLSTACIIILGGIWLKAIGVAIGIFLSEGINSLIQFFVLSKMEKGNS